MLGPATFHAPEFTQEHVLTGALLRYRPGSADVLAEQVVLIKFCVSNAMAGGIIGTRGQNRDILQQVSGGARIQLSRPNEFYPGTSERVLTITGTLGSVLTALFAIAQNFAAPEPLPLEAVFMSVETVWKLLLPASVCGYILGSGGRTIRSITSGADANISLSPATADREDLPRERIATISGGCVQSVRAVGLIMDKLLLRPYYEPAEPQFEGQFPSSRMALLARTGRLRNPPGLVAQHMQQRQQHLQQQHIMLPQLSLYQHQLHQQQQGAMAQQVPSGALYAHPAAMPPGGAGSAFVYVPLQPPMVPLAPASVGLPHHPPMAHAGVTVSAPAPPAAAGTTAVHALSTSMAGLSLGSGSGAPAATHAAAAGAAPAPAAPSPPPASGGGGSSASHGQALPAAPAPALESGAAEWAGVLGPRLEVSIEVPENRIGLLIGRGGETLNAMQRLLNVSIHIPRRQHAPGEVAGPAAPPNMRRVTISGARNAVEVAHAFIVNRLRGSAVGAMQPPAPTSQQR